MRFSNSQTRVLSIARLPLSRLAVGFLLIFALALLVVSKTNNNATRKFSTIVAETISPVISLLAKPVEAISATNNYIHEMMNLRENNRLLQSENARLKQSQIAALELKNENDKLRALLKFAPVGKSAYTSARVITDSSNAYSRSVLITAGEEQKIAEDSPVINESGLVGRVIDVGKKTARVLLLSDVNSRIPVVSEKSREHSIASGTNGDALSLLYTPETSNLKVGEKIVTSGDGGVLPPGLPVGIVTKIEKTGVTVKPFVDWYRLEFVSIVDFSM